MIQILIVSLLLLTGACSPVRNHSFQLQSKHNGIIGGTYVAENSTIGASTVGIYDTENESACTGTLITKTVIITAAHCVTTKHHNLRIVFGNELSATLNSREPDIQKEFVRRATASIVHPLYTGDDEKLAEWNDIALIQFSGNLPTGYKPVQMLDDQSLLKKGTVVTMAGYGSTRVQVTNINEKKIPNLKKAIETGDITCDEPEIGEKQKCYKIEFKGEDDLLMTTALLESLLSSEIRLDESNGHSTCAGDSGGPAFMEVQGNYVFFGITSRGSYACDSHGIYTNALYFKSWIDTSLKLLHEE